MQCEMCGKNTESLSLSEVEGVEMKVCTICSKFGTKVNVNKPQKTNYYRKKVQGKSQDDNKRIYEKVVNKRNYSTRLVEDYAQVIKKGREQAHFKHVELAMKLAEKESVLLNIERGKLRPSMQLARKIEQLLEIKLIEENVKEEKVEYQRSANKALTIGDLIASKLKK